MSSLETRSFENLLLRSLPIGELAVFQSGLTLADLPMGRSIESRRLLLCFAQSFLVQPSETAVANARATIEDRLARRLLMAQDRVQRCDPSHA